MATHTKLNAELFLTAAESIDNGSMDFACHAIDDAAGNPGWPFDAMPEAQWFQRVFGWRCGISKRKQRFYGVFGHASFPQNQARRVIALLLAYEMVKAGDV